MNKKPNLVITCDANNTLKHIHIEGEERFRLVRENNGQGIWGLYRVIDDAVTTQLDRDQYSNDLIERIECGAYDALDHNETTAPAL